MNTLPENWKENKALTVQELVKLAKKVGLKPLPDKDSYTSQGLEDLLRAHGPIWAAGYWYGPGHAIVITGVDGTDIYLNDPDQGKAKTGTLAWFNEKLLKIPSRMMIKDPKRY